MRYDPKKPIRSKLSKSLFSRSLSTYSRYNSDVNGPSLPPTPRDLELRAPPWSGEKRASEKSLVAEYLTQKGASPLILIVHECLESTENSEKSRDFRLIKRLCHRYPDFFDLYDLGGSSTPGDEIRYWVRPTNVLKHLRNNLGSLVQSRRNSTSAVDDSYPKNSRQEQERNKKKSYALDRTLSILEITRQMNDDTTKRNLAMNFQVDRRHRTKDFDKGDDPIEN